MADIKTLEPREWFTHAERLIQSNKPRLDMISFCHVGAERLLSAFLRDVEPLPALASDSIRNFDLAAFERLERFFKGRFVAQGMTENKLLRQLTRYLVVQVMLGHKSIEHIGRRLIEPYLWEIALTAKQSPSSDVHLQHHHARTSDQDGDDINVTFGANHRLLILDFS